MPTLTEGKIGKTLVVYALPILFSNLLLQTSLLVEALLLGSQRQSRCRRCRRPFIALIQALPLAACGFRADIRCDGQRDYARLHRQPHHFHFLLPVLIAMAIPSSLPPYHEADRRARMYLPTPLSISFNSLVLFSILPPPTEPILQAAASRAPFPYFTISTVAAWV